MRLMNISFAALISRIDLLFQTMRLSPSLEDKIRKTPQSAGGNSPFSNTLNSSGTTIVAERLDGLFPDSSVATSSVVDIIPLGQLQPFQPIDP
jgi:hypothetical protein